VLARYAGGGSIALAGGEAITRSSSVNGATRGALDYINRTGAAPGNDSEVVRVLTQGFNNQTQVLADRLDILAANVKGDLKTHHAPNTTTTARAGSQKVAA